MSHHIRNTGGPITLDHAAFFLGHRARFGPLRLHQVDGLAFLLKSFAADSRWEDIRHTAYALATIRRETGISRGGVPQMYLPVEEAGSKTYLSKYYLRPSLRRNLGNIKLSDAWVYKGRGYVQITGRANYTRFAGLLDLPLLDQPELALEPQHAFNIMTRGMHEGLFTGKKLTDYIQVPYNSQFSYYYARKIINALDHAREIAVDAVIMEGILRTSGYGQ